MPLHACVRAAATALQRTALSDDDIRAEVAALEQQGHRRLLVLTGEHPKYTFDQFLHVSWVVVVGQAWRVLGERSLGGGSLGLVSGL